MRFHLLLLGAISCFSGIPCPAAEAPVKGWPAGVGLIEITSSIDHTPQPALSWSPTSDEPRPLLVGLHTWSGDHTQSLNGANYARWCIEQNWHFIFPNFRGPNRTASALGSDLAVQDIVDAVAHLKKSSSVDCRRIYLIGSSGGGHMAMLMAGRNPEIWAGVSAWCGISDIAAWHSEHLKDGKPDEYARDIESALGGPPAGTRERLDNAKSRSPITWLHAAKDVPLDLNHGIDDGRTGSVPFRHSLYAFNAVHPGSFAEAEITRLYETRSLQPSATPPPADPLYAPKSVVFRTSKGNTRVTLFKGGHEILYSPALHWLARQEKGQAANWTPGSHLTFHSESTSSGK